MRLTLRTLLAYLDDTLEPHEIREIGQKVAESDAAQELVARIKQVTRRRRLTTPPPGGPNAKFDANIMAEYLDNELSTELVAELEKTCLESDVHLAEVASCHQILTLVLGEPALVPPTARERMYGLVRGREAIPFRKARSRDGVGEGEGADRDADDPLLPGLPSSRGWLIWALPLAAILALAALAFAFWQALPPTPPPAVAKVAPTPVDAPPPTPPKDDSPTPPGGPPMNPPTAPMNPPPMNPPPMNPPMNPSSPPMTPTPPDARPKPPSKVRASVGAYLAPQRGESSILVQRLADQPGWKRLAAGKSDVFSTDDLVSLPGYNSELALGGVHLLLHGHVPQFSVHPLMDYLMESAVRLNQPEPGFDADLTLDRGRIYLSSPHAKDPVKVRLRFADEVWDLTLINTEKEDAEVGVDLVQTYLGDINYLDEPPLRNLDLVVLSGRADVKIDYRPTAVLAPRGHIQWDNKGQGASGPQPVPAKDWPLVQALWSKTPPTGATQADRDMIAQMREALDSLSLLMTDKKKVDDALQEARPRQTAEKPLLRVLAVYSFGAIDQVDRVLEVLCTEESVNHDVDRRAAIFTLDHWIGRDKANGLLLYNEAKHTGLLIDSRHLHDPDARNVFDLLHNFRTTQRRLPATFDWLTSRLSDNTLAVRELAYWHLLKLSAGARVQLPAYNAAWEPAERDQSAQAWKALIGKELPPPPPMAPPAGQ